MNESLPTISLTGLALAAIPAIVVIVILFRWTATGGTAIHAMARMLGQLLIIGYLLTYLFAIENPLYVIGVLTVMLTAACWISLRPVKRKSRDDYVRALFSIFVGGAVTLAVVTGFVLRVEPWFSPMHVIPLGGMIFAGSMNAVSLAAERFSAEQDAGAEYATARRGAYDACLIPTLNSLFAVGLVSLPGMMTGQILSGVSPLVAVRYQIVVMCMLLGAAGISAALYLATAPRDPANPG